MVLTKKRATPGKCELFDNSSPFPWLFFLFCGMLCCCKGGDTTWQNAEPTGRVTSESGRMAAGRADTPLATTRRDGKGHLPERAGKDPVGGQVEAESGH